jgi:DNA-binding protein
MAEEKQKKESAEKPAKAARTPRTAQTAQSNENTVLIGKKPVMNYVVACLTFFNSGSKKVVVKARGRAISRAVDTVELLRRAFMKDVQLQGINISTEEVTRSEGQKANVSAVEITLTRP